MAKSEPPVPALTPGAVALVALSLSVGWGIRGNFGHEAGAMIAGALAAMAVALGSGRADWWRRVAYFAMFGAIGWSFGGSMSYMKVVAYTHSGDSASVAYGFACLFVIGFLWAALGGAGTALAAVLDRDRLTELFPASTAVFLAWGVQETWLDRWLPTALAPVSKIMRPYDTDGMGVLVAIAAVICFSLASRSINRASSLILHLAVGWWVGFLVLVLGLGLRMSPPRGDNWAGCVGMLGGLFVYCRRHALEEVTRAALISGFVGGTGFAAASMLKLVEVTSGLTTNWHSILEQTTGLFNGLAIAVAMRGLIARGPRMGEEPPVRRWTEVYSVAFVLLLVTYLNLRKNPGTWIDAGAVPKEVYGLTPNGWFRLAYLFLAVALLLPLIRHLRRPLPVLSPSWLGRGQLLYLIFLWWMVVGNFERAVVRFGPERIVTEGVLHANATICTLLALLAVPETARSGPLATTGRRLSLPRLLGAGVLAAGLSIAVDWAVVRAAWGDRHASGHSALQIRFGPRATNDTR